MPDLTTSTGKLEYIHRVIDTSNIRDHTTSIPPDKWNIFGSAEDFNALPETHKQQILFLNTDARKYLLDLLHNAAMLTGGGWDPFAKGNFSEVITYNGHFITETENSPLKKWLYQCRVPFRTWVWLLGNSDVGLFLTWKMVIKYAHSFFGGDDIIVFDKTMNWCLSYYHENDMFFGRNNIYDMSDDEENMRQLNERKRNFPKFRHPYLSDDHH